MNKDPKKNSIKCVVVGDGAVGKYVYLKASTIYCLLILLNYIWN